MTSSDFALGLPILYSFRRCPYAMRARLAIQYAGQQVALREVVLKDKPAALLQASAKGTVPVLVLPDGSVVDESLDIMRWALGCQDPDDWLLNHNIAAQQTAFALIAENDGSFKQALDRYKYADRHPQQPAEAYREQGAHFLRRLEQRLHDHEFLTADQISIADTAIFPFVRQFAHVDKTWFDEARDYPQLQRWLHRLLESAAFNQVMTRYKAWDGTRVDLFPPADHSG